MGCIISEHVDMKREDRGGADLGDREWMVRWLEIFHAEIINQKDNLNKDHGQIVE